MLPMNVAAPSSASTSERTGKECRRRRKTKNEREDQQASGKGGQTVLSQEVSPNWPKRPNHAAIQSGHLGKRQDDNGGSTVTRSRVSRQPVPHPQGQAQLLFVLLTKHLDRLEDRL